jgi:hypothetical protein
MTTTAATRAAAMPPMTQGSLLLPEDGAAETGAAPAA